MKKVGFLKSKKLVRNTTILTVWLIVIALISSSSLSLELVNNTEINSANFENRYKDTTLQGESLTGLDPKNTIKQTIPALTLRNDNKIRDENIYRDISLKAKYMYGIIVYSPCHEEGICYFPLDDPGNITDGAGGGGSAYYMAGATWTTDNRWLACEYNSGSLWEIDIETGDMVNIGGGGTSCNGLAWDPIYNRLYGAGSTGLYEYDPETGEQEYIGNFGVPNSIIAIAINMDGICYAWDVLFSGESTLYTVDLETGVATEVGSMGQNLCYAQDGCFDWDTGILYLAAYSNSGFLAKCDTETGELTIIGDFECGAEISATIIPWSGFVEHDVDLISINSPESGYAIPEIPMQVTVKNRGNHTETTNVKMQVYKFEAGPVLFEENFSGSFPPDDWTTDFWNQSFTNVAGGESPEAAVYNYDQYNGWQYYDNFIMTPPIDATGWEKVTLQFRWAANLYYPQYCNFYVKYRRNETSPWKDVTPWNNPLNDNSGGELYTINCYGLGDMGDGFQVMFQYIGYYYYFNYFYLDDVKITAFNSLEEYNETVEDITLEPGEEVIVDFPSWTPADLQNPDYEGTWQDYLVKAWSLFEDDRPSNDNKERIIDLYFPWMHDIEITSIDSPCEDGPGRIFPVQATIKNVGQYAECCIPMNIETGEQVALDTILVEDDWDIIPPDGWYDEHKDYSEDYGWAKSNTSYSGGSSPEAKLNYNYAKPDYVFYSYSIDTLNSSSCQLEFKSYINHYSGSGLYALEAGYSTDKETWNVVWHTEPSSSGSYNIKCPIEGGYETLYIGFWVKGDPYYFNNWYIDDVSLKVLDYVLEYSESVCQSDYIEPGESITFEFDDWIPEYLQYETTGSRDYIVHAEIHMFGDENPGNDIKSVYFTLDYWHDVGIEGGSSFDGITCWDNGEPDGRNGLSGSVYYGYDNLIVDDFDLEWEATISGGQISLVWGSGAGTGHLDTLYMWFFEETGDCEPSMDEYEKVEVTEFTETLTGDYYFSRPEVIIYVEFNDVEVPAGKSWVGFQPDSVGDDIAYLLTADGFGCEIMASLPYWGYPRWSSSSYIWGEEYDLAWKLFCPCPCLPPIHTYFQPGTESIEAVAINHGTFKELNLTCNAQIWEYITNPEKGTLVYEDNITNIDLDEPLGGTVNLTFNEFTFEYEGRYGLFLDMPGKQGRDDYPNNNKLRWGIGVDDTNPISSHTLDPPNPDGENGWYVNDIEVTLTAYDPYIMDVSSGVDMIKYRVNDGAIQIIDGDFHIIGSFLITQADDGDDVKVEYWAADNVGNEETHHTFKIDMDQTCPNIDLTYECVSGNPMQGWLMLFTATAEDDTSGMDRVEFYLNGGLQAVESGPGPEYEWSFIYHGDFIVDVRADAYDKAGNWAHDIIEDPKSTSYNLNIQNLQQKTQSQIGSNIINKHLEIFFCYMEEEIDE